MHLSCIDRDAIEKLATCHRILIIQILDFFCWGSGHALGSGIKISLGDTRGEAPLNDAADDADKLGEDLFVVLPVFFLYLVKFKKQVVLFRW